MKNAFCKMCATICGRFRLNEGGVASYVNQMKAKCTAKWGIQIAEMIFQTISRIPALIFSYISSYFGSLKELFSDTMRLNTIASGVESFASTQKKPCLTNWKLSYALAPFSAGST